MNPTRRHWLLGSVAFAAVAAAQQRAYDIARGAAPEKFAFFDTGTAADVAAIAQQILPSGDGPGAREAGVIYFIDRALETFDTGKQEDYRRGMADLQAMRLRMFPSSTAFALLPSAQQVELIRAIEKTEFFETIRIHTLLGFLGNPSYGGNRGEVGWKHIGFDDRMAFQPPFGYYDAEAN